MHQLIMDFETFFQCPFRQQKDEFSKKIFNFFFRIFSLKIKNFKDNCPGLKNIYTFLRMFWVKIVDFLGVFSRTNYPIVLYLFKISSRTNYAIILN